MSVSSDGILYFGFQVGGENEKPEWFGDSEDFNEWLTDKAGISDKPYKERSEFINRCPADMGMFCSYEYPMYILIVRGASYRAARGYVAEISQTHLSFSKEKIEAFRKWCLDNNIEYREPKWLLCSMYG